MALVLGRTDEPLDVLRATFCEHRRRFGPTDWATRFFEQGIDDREPDADVSDDPLVVGLPGPWSR
jgi:hypothetical protein